MTESLRTPRLDFEDWTVYFPERGHGEFYELSDLQNPAKQPGIGAKGIWLFRAESGSSGLIPVMVDLYRNGEQAISIIVLHHEDEIKISHHEARFFEVYHITNLSDTSRLIKRQCPYCQVNFQTGDNLYVCPLCHEGYHEDCWEEMIGERCFSRKCRFSPGHISK